MSAIDIYKTLPGMHMHPAERELLRSVAFQAETTFGEIVIVNIGIASAYGACSMHCLRAGSEKARLIGIDIEEQGPVPETLGPNTAYLIGNSFRLCHVWITPVHVLFIDGSHVYSDLLRDTWGWAPKVVVGGYMLFHDYGHSGPGFEHVAGVKRAIDEWEDSKESAGWKWVGDVVSIRIYRRIS